jgi:hypothetical protein
MKAFIRLAFVVAAALGLSGKVYANTATLTCTSKTADVSEVSSYPATVHYALNFWCDFVTDCTSTQLYDTLIGALATPEAPRTFTLGSSSINYSYDILSYEDCAASAGVPASGPVSLVNAVTGTVMYGLHGPEDGPITGCQTVVTCNPPTTGGPTRTLGFFKTHVDALNSCIGMGSINLGFDTVTEIGQALWVLWADPSKFTNVAKARLLLGRQVLVAECNSRLFETQFGGMSSAVSMLGGTQCALMKSMASDADAFNNAGDLMAFPAGFNPGSADPAWAKSLIGTFSIPSATCTQ